MGRGGTALGTRQQNFRLPSALIVALEAECGKGRRWRNKSAAVQELLEAELFVVEAEVVEPGPVSVSARWSSVVSAADRGTLVRVADPDLFAEGSLVRTPAEEVMRVRSVDGDLLTVDRGVGRAPRRSDEVDHDGVAPLRPGDEVCVVGHVDFEASPAAATTIGAVGGGADAGSPLPGVSADGSASGSDGLSAVEPPATELGGQGAEPAPAPPDSSPGAASVAAGSGGSVDLIGSPVAPGEARAPFPVGRAELMEGRADSDGDRSAAAQEAELVEVAAWLAERTGAPVAVCRRRIREGRVTIGGRPAKGLASHLAKSMVELVELDGERV